MSSGAQQRAWGISVLVLMAGVLALIAYGVETEPKAPRLPVCWAASGAARYVPTCSPGDVPGELRWSKIPILVATSAEASKDEVAAVSGAVSYWDERLGFRLFEIVRAPAGAVDIVVVPAVAGTGDKEGGATSHLRLADGSLRALVRLVATPFEGDLWAAAVHELGHVAGLAHSQGADSAMRPVLIFDGSGGPPPTMWIEDSARSLLRGLYRPRG